MRKLYYHCCGSERFVNYLCEQSATTYEELVPSVEKAFALMTRQDWAEAFSNHPQIGHTEAKIDPFSLATSKREQSSVAQATASDREKLLDLNRRYLEKFGFIFITFAQGKQPAQIIEELSRRIQTPSVDEEFDIAITQQKLITFKRLKDILKN